MTKGSGLVGAWVFAPLKTAALSERVEIYEKACVRRIVSYKNRYISTFYSGFTAGKFLYFFLALLGRRALDFGVVWQLLRYRQHLYASVCNGFGWFIVMVLLVAGGSGTDISSAEVGPQAQKPVYPPCNSSIWMRLNGRCGRLAERARYTRYSKTARI